MGEEPTGLHCRLDDLLAERGMTLTRLSELVGISIVNLSILKNDRAKAIRFSTLRAICDALNCEVGDLLVLTTGNPKDGDGNRKAKGHTRKVFGDDQTHI